MRGRAGGRGHGNLVGKFGQLEDWVVRFFFQMSISLEHYDPPRLANA
jgi:hypothetical protein